MALIKSQITDVMPTPVRMTSLLISTQQTLFLDSHKSQNAIYRRTY